MSKTVLIGCKLPNGLVVKGTKGQEITLNGVNTSLIVGGYGITHVEENEAAMIFATYADHCSFRNQAVFTADSTKVDDIMSVADELQDIETGLEGIDPANPGKKGGDEGELTPSDKQIVPDATEKTVRAKKTASPADKAAAAELASKLASK